jgi:PhnB protein
LEQITPLVFLTESESQAKDWFGKLSKNGKIPAPLDNQFWGVLFGECKDEYEINWIISFENEK